MTFSTQRIGKNYLLSIDRIVDDYGVMEKDLMNSLIELFAPIPFSIKELSEEQLLQLKESKCDGDNTVG